METTGSPYEDVETAVWGVLSRRRWFGKHVEEEEMADLEKDLKQAIRDALEMWVS